MPRRRALTEAQLDALFALPVTEADLIRHWTLDGADLAAVRDGSGNLHWVDEWSFCLTAARMAAEQERR